MSDTETSEELASRLVQIWNQIEKPWVAVVDAGPAYDAMAGVLSDGGIPVFRTADRAVRILELYCAQSDPGRLLG